MIENHEKQLAGTWFLEKMFTEFPGVAPQQHEGAEGTLIYDMELKTVFARISRPDDKQAGGKLLFEYAGHFEFGDQPHQVTHNIEWATNPKMVGKPMKRKFELAADGRLLITGPSAEYADAMITISWIRPEARPA
jgi:hypothetical protein